MIDQLINIYLEKENWHEYKLPREEAEKYFKRLIGKGRILWVTDNKRIVGYVESWRINYEQFGRIICKETFSAYTEDVETGNIAYVANTWIHPDYRWEVYKILRNKFFNQNKDCEYFVGDARRKRTGLIKVFKGGKYGTGKDYNRTNTNNTTATTSYCYA